MYERAIAFLKDVRAELAKVSWPSRSELVDSTIVVIVISVALSVFIGLVDFLLSVLLKVSHIL